VVPPKLTPTLNKNPCMMQQGGKSQRHSFQVRRIAESVRLYPCSITGAPELGYLPVGVRPFNSEVHSASALLPDSHHHGHKTMPIRLSGNRFEAYSSSSAFLDTIGRDFMTDGGGCQEEITQLLAQSRNVPSSLLSGLQFLAGTNGASSKIGEFQL
jgi:hypothetical protein